MSLRMNMLKVITAALLLLAMLFYLSLNETDRVQRATAGQSGRFIEQGAGLYDLHCRTCHGVKGEGVGQLGPALSDEHFFRNRTAEVGWQSTLHQYVSVTTTFGRMMGTRPMYAGDGTAMVMPPWHRDHGGPLRTDQINALTAFVLNWAPTATGKVTLTELEVPVFSLQDPATLARGQHVFAQRCSACHHLPGLAPPDQAGPDLAEIGRVAVQRRSTQDPAAYIRESVLIPFAFVAPEYAELAEKHPCGAVLSETEMTAISAYLLQ